MFHNSVTFYSYMGFAYMRVTDKLAIVLRSNMD